MEQKTDTAPNINGHSESRPLCICIQFGGMSRERVRRKAEGGMIVSPFTAHYHLSLSLLFDYEWMPFGRWQVIVCQHQCWTQRMRFSCENLSEQQQLLKALMRTRTGRFIINLWLLGTWFSGRWSVTVQLCAIPAEKQDSTKANYRFHHTLLSAELLKYCLDSRSTS